MGGSRSGEKLISIVDVSLLVCHQSKEKFKTAERNLSEDAGIERVI